MFTMTANFETQVKLERQQISTTYRIYSQKNCISHGNRLQTDSSTPVYSERKLENDEF